MFITLPQYNETIEAAGEASLLEALRAAGITPETPCGGHGSCKKCRVLVDGAEQLACQTRVDHDMSVIVPEQAETTILARGVEISGKMNPWNAGPMLAFDIGTTTVVCYLLDGETGAELGSASMLNPQTAFGADVISRIQAALNGQARALSVAIRQGMTTLILDVCSRAGVQPEEIGTISVVGNPCMQQLFMDMPTENLAKVPFAPLLRQAEARNAGEFLPLCKDARLLIVPDLSGYVGADTMGCILATGMYDAEQITLLVDIGTNGEMVLGSRERMAACSTAAGPALEGARIQFGMRGAPGAIDHVYLKDGALQCSVIGGGEAKGICGSGLIDAVAAALEGGLINKRGRIQREESAGGQRIIPLSGGIYLTQDDIREVQLAKGAIASGIRLMAGELGIGIEDIDRVLLAGAFGSFMNPSSACRISLLPPTLQGRVRAVGNAAGSGARLLACDRDQLALAQRLTEKIRFIELASLPAFQHTFAEQMML